MAPLTIDALPDEGLAAALLRVTSDPTQRDRMYEHLRSYCHESRNILNSLKLSLHLAKRGLDPDRLAHWRELERKYRDVEQFILRLQTIIRPMALSVVRLPLALLLDGRTATWSAWMTARGRRLIMEPPAEPSDARYDPMHMEQALDAFVEWRAAAGPPGQPARLQWRTERGECHLEWSESDGHGGEGPEETAGVLALPLLGRVTSAHGGSLWLDETEGFRVHLRWPADGSPPQEPTPCCPTPPQAP